MTLVVRLLGPLEVLDDDLPLDLGPPQQRLLLALLALHQGRPLQLHAIELALWDDEPPPTATKVIQTYVSRLRKQLGAEAIRSVAHGYALDSSITVDAACFRECFANGEYVEALALWRGPALADLPALETEARQLEDLRVAALEEKFELALERGEGPALVAELEGLTAAHPTRGRLLGQLVLALYRSDRQADALAAYRRGRDALVNDLGIEPSAALRTLERRILQQDPTLLAAASDKVVTRHIPKRKTLVLSGALVAVIGIAAAAGIAAIAGRGSKLPIIEIHANTLLRIDPKSGRIAGSTPIGRDATALDATPDALWIASERERAVSRIDVRTLRPVTIGEPHPVAFLTHDDNGNVYASGWDFPLVWQIDPRTVQIVRSFKVRTRALGLSVGGGSLWVADRLANAVTKFDLATKRIDETIHVGVNPLATAFGFGSLWVANNDSGTVAVIQPGAAKPLIMRGIPSPDAISAAAGGIWVASTGAHAVYRLDPDTRATIARISLHTPTDLVTGVSAGPYGVWAVEDHDVVRIDPADDRVVSRIHFPHGTEPKAVAQTAGSVWITVGDPKDDM